MSEESPRSSVAVRIAGEEHTIRANAEPDYTRKCARIVDERIQRIRERAGPLESHRTAILAALSLTDELLQARGDLERHHRELASRADNLARRLEDVAAPGEPEA